MAVFNEDTRVKIPATIQVLKIGYDYQSLKDADIDFQTKIFINRFKPALEEITERDFSYDEIKEILMDINNVIREMKDSGIEWNNKIPVEWSSINPKALFSQRKDKAFEKEKQLTASQQYGIMYQSDYMELTGTKVVTVEKDFNILKHVEAGDFVISMRSFQGGLEYSELSGSISSAYVMLVPNLELVYPRFYRWLLKSEVYIRALQSTSNMVRDLFLNLLDEIKSLGLKNNNVYEAIKDGIKKYRLTLDSSYDIEEFQKNLKKELAKGYYLDLLEKYRTKILIICILSISTIILRKFMEIRLAI